jgi:chorismate mutase
VNEWPAFKLRFVNLLLALVLSGVGLGASVGPYMPLWVRLVVAFGSILLMVFFAVQSTSYVRRSKALILATEQDTLAVAQARQELVAAVAECKQLNDRLRDAYTVISQTDPERDPGIAALVLDGLAEMLRGQALRQAAEEDQ